LGIESKEFSGSLSTISVWEYDSLEEVREWLVMRDKEIQCVVGGDAVSHKRSAAFGMAQRPTLFDYADEVDTMKFLM
ncbi:MAG: aldehyde dehydrogenase, partial [Rikenellaceae bacterium]